MTNQEQIQQLVRQQETAIRNKDIPASMSQYAPDVLSFDVVSSLQKVGIDACRDRLKAWLAQFPGPIAYTVDDLEVVAVEEMAYCHSINHVNGKTATGTVIDMRWRATVCYQKITDKWLVTHEHSSVPFDPESGKALIDLTV
ncbi:nuclear transport factor 2 family protein [Fibrella sp. ES10-3-2-2]|nr:hypothetical protein A6C57_21375 [Fibrella sp. ES10-3-2-2]